MEQYSTPAIGGRCGSGWTLQGANCVQPRVSTSAGLSLVAPIVVSSVPGFQGTVNIPGVGQEDLGIYGSVINQLCRSFPNLPGCGTGPNDYSPGPTQVPTVQNTPTVIGAPTCAPAGYHWNKGRYCLKNGGVVEPGTRLVKNRRMNPLNPRALARAVRRGDSFVRFAASVGMLKPKTGLKKRKRLR